MLELDYRMPIGGKRRLVSLFEKPHLGKGGKPIKGEEGSMMSAIVAVAGRFEIVRRMA